MGALRRLTRIGLSLALPRTRWIERGPCDSGTLALTFDDGPHPEHTPRLLDVLADLGIPATFFVVGQCAAAHPHLVRRMVAEGHQVANHTWFHHEPAEVSAEALRREVRDTRALLQDLTGSDIRLFRPPKGEFSWAKLRMLWGEGQTIALWTSDPKDFSLTSEDQADRWARHHVPQAGQIVLLHDNHPWGARMLPTLVERARDAELRFETLAGWTTAFPLEPIPPRPEQNSAAGSHSPYLSSAEAT